MFFFFFFFFKQKTAYEISVRDWSSDVCSSDLAWATAGLPMKPAGGAGATAGSHVRNGPTLVVARTAAKLQGGGTAPGVGIQPWSEVELIDPVASATSDMVPR